MTVSHRTYWKIDTVLAIDMPGLGKAKAEEKVQLRVRPACDLRVFTQAADKYDRPVTRASFAWSSRGGTPVPLSDLFALGGLFIFAMAFDALKHRDVTEINRMLERFVGLVA